MTRAVAIALIGSTLIRAGWVRVDAPGIELFSSAGEKPGQQLMERFELIRSIFRQSGIVDGPLRLRVVQFDSPEELHRYHEGVDGFYQPGADHDYIALHSGPEAGRVAFHEYVHLVLKHSFVPLPRWFDEGTAEFYSTIQVEKSGLRIGQPIPSHVALLDRERWLTAAEINSRRNDAIFYAQTWALVHMLNLAPRWRDGMPGFVSLLSQEKPVQEAFRQAFGRTMDDAIAALPVYLKTMSVARIPAVIDRPGKSTAIHLSSDEGAIACAGLALSVRRQELADSLMAKTGDSPASEAMRGTIALAQDRRDEARRHLDRAIEMGSQDAALYFEYAMLERDAGHPDTNLLLKVIAIDPDFADAQFLLGVRATDDRNFSRAIDQLKAAVRVRPDRSNYWYALGYAQAKAGRRDAASVSVSRALMTAENDMEEQMAHALAGLSDDVPGPALSRPAVTTPSSWKPPKGDARVQGTLVNFICDAAPPRLELRDSSGATLTLVLQHPTEIELVNTSQPTLSIPCGAQSLPMAVDYDRASSNVTRIEFRL